MVFGGEKLITTNKFIFVKYKNFMDDIAPQEKKWKGKFGKDYTLRNPLGAKEIDKLYFRNYGITRTEINKEFLGNLNLSIKILEIGANVGVQLMFLQKMGFKNLYGIEINREAIELAKSITKNIDIIQGSASDTPFKDNYFDLVFTSGLLIHIAPADLEKVMKEIYRVTKKYIWGFEYYADKYSEISYRGKRNLLWKANFPELYLKLFKDLKPVKEKRLEYLNNENRDIMFLLKKHETKK